MHDHCTDRDPHDWHLVIRPGMLPGFCAGVRETPPDTPAHPPESTVGGPTPPGAGDPTCGAVQRVCDQPAGHHPPDLHETVRVAWRQDPEGDRGRDSDLTALAGSDPGFTGGVDAVAYVRWQSCPHHARPDECAAAGSGPGAAHPCRCGAATITARGTDRNPPTTGGVMTWVRRQSDQPQPHFCDAPAPEHVGDLWRCDQCGDLWRTDHACQICRVHGRTPHRGMHTLGYAWLPVREGRIARWWRQWRARLNEEEREVAELNRRIAEARGTDRDPPTTGE